MAVLSRFLRDLRHVAMATFVVVSVIFSANSAWGYTITLNRNGGSGGTGSLTANSTSVYYGSVYLVQNSNVTSNSISLPSRSGYTFLGYAASSTVSNTNSLMISSSGTMTTDGSASARKANANQTWYAVWGKSCSQGQFLPAGSSTCTTCPANYYCPGGTIVASSSADRGKNSCPGYTDSTARALTGNYSGATRLAFYGVSWQTGLKNINECSAIYYFQNEKGIFTDEAVKYSSTSGKYDATSNIYYKRINPGYYGSERYSSNYCDTNQDTRRMLYRQAIRCPANYYCPGYTGSATYTTNYMPLCSSGTYGETVGKFSCPSGYSYSVVGSIASTDCHSTTGSSCSSIRPLTISNGSVSSWGTGGGTYGKYYNNTNTTYPFSTSSICPVADVSCNTGYSAVTNVSSSLLSKPYNTAPTSSVAMASTKYGDNVSTKGLYDGEYYIQLSDGTKVYGDGICSSTSGTVGNFGSPSTSSGAYCWCRVSHYYDSNSTYSQTAVSRYKYAKYYTTQEGGSTACPYSCAEVCRNNMVTDSSWRSSLIGDTKGDAYCAPSKYQITFNNNDGSGTTSIGYVRYGYSGLYSSSSVTNTTTKSVPIPTRAGYIFGGWYTAASGGSPVYNSNGSLRSSALSGYTNSSGQWITTTARTLYAHWIPLSTITLNRGYGNNEYLYENYGYFYLNNTGTSEYNEGDDLFTDYDYTYPTVTGFSFDGYYSPTCDEGIIDHHGSYQQSQCLDQDVDDAETLYAEYIPTTYHVTLNNQDATTAGATDVYYKYAGAASSCQSWCSANMNSDYDCSYMCVNSPAYSYYRTNSFSSGNQYGSNGSTMDSAYKPTKTGYTFGGYYSGQNCSGTQYIRSDGVFVNDLRLQTNISTLYACWTLVEKTITLNPNYSSFGGTKTAGQTALYTKYATGVYTDSARSSAITTTTNITAPTLDDWIFEGYYNTSGSGGTQMMSTAIVYSQIVGRLSSTTMINNAKNITADTTWYARWRKFCDSGTYYPGNYSSTCTTCPAGSYCPGTYVYNYDANQTRGIYNCEDTFEIEGLTSDAGATGPGACYKPGTTTCAVANPVTVDNGIVQYANSGTVKCKYYLEYDDDEGDYTSTLSSCIPDRGVCDMVDATCMIGYHKNNTNLLNNFSGTYYGYSEFEPNGEVEASQNSYYLRNGKTNGEYDTYFNSGNDIIRGYAKCNNSANDQSNDDEGENCWCQTTKYKTGNNWYSAISDWVYADDMDGECQEECSYRCSYPFIGRDNVANSRSDLFDSAVTYQCSVNTYDVVFNKNANDATGTMSNQSFTYGTADNLTSNAFTRKGYTFAGWATSANGAVVYRNGQSVNNLTTTNNGTYNLYAKWTQCADGSYCPGNNTSVLCSTLGSGFDHSSGSRSATTDCYKYCTQTSSVCNTNVTCPNNATCTYNTSYTVTSEQGTQYYQGSCSAAVPETPSCPIATMTCDTGYNETNGECVAVTPSVTYSCGTGTTGTAPATTTATYGQTFTPSANAGTCAKSGYMFVGWKDANNNFVHAGEAFTYNSTSGMNLTAQWEQPKFTVTTINMDANDDFELIITAAGSFYIDWGDGKITAILRDTPVGSTDIDATIRHTYTTSGVHTIRFAGLATGYYDNGEENRPELNISQTSTIDFIVDMENGVLYPKISTVSGSLGQIFPTLVSAPQGQLTNPKFIGTFAAQTYLTTVPAGLFSGVTAPGTLMFDGTFANTGLTEIPENIFNFGITSGNTTLSATKGLFYRTFAECSGLQSIPANLFNRISGSAMATFYSTFSDCTGLTSVPSGLFSHITGSAGALFWNTFYNCSNLTTVPANLFAGVSGTPQALMFATTFSNSGLTYFESTNNGTVSSVRYVPNNFFGSLSSTGYSAQNLWMTDVFAETNVADVCDAGTYQYITGFEGDWSGKVSCTACPAISNTSAHAFHTEYTSVGDNQCWALMYFTDSNNSFFKYLLISFNGIDNAQDLNQDLSQIQDSGYTSTSSLNQNVDALFLKCKYNSQSGAYDRCFLSDDMIMNFQICKNGYYANLPTSINMSNLDSALQPIGNFANFCVQGAAGKYTKFYDIMRLTEDVPDDTENLTEEELFTISAMQDLKNNIGTIIQGVTDNNTLTYSYLDIANGTSFPPLTLYYDDCPIKYPNSPAGAWQVAQCYANVTFNANGGTFGQNNDTTVVQTKAFDGETSVSNGNLVVTANNYSISAPYIERTGYVLTGWNTAANGSGDTLNGNATYSGNQTFYAQWTLDTYPIYYLLKGGTNNANNPSRYTVEDTPVTLSAPTKAHATFAGWCNYDLHGSTSCSANQTLTINSLYDQYVGANWTCDAGYSAIDLPAPNVIPTVEYHSISNGGETSTNGASLQPGEFTLAYTTGSVQGVMRGNAKCTNIQPSSDELNDLGVAYNNTINDNTPNGNSCWMKMTNWTPSGSSAQTLSDYWMYLGTSDNCADTCSSEANSAKLNPDGWNADLYRAVAFDHLYECTPNTYTITYNTNGGTNDANAPTTYNIETSTITLPIPTRSGYTFGGWYDNSGLTGNAITTIATGSTGNKEYWAKWTQNLYNIMYKSNGGSVSIPNSYQVLEYIEGQNNVQYIDTGIVPNSNMNMYFKGQFVSVTGDTQSSFLMGARDVSAARGVFIQYTHNNSILTDFFQANGRWSLTNLQRNAGNTVELSVVNALGEVKLNGTSLGTHQFVPDDTTQYTLYLNALNDHGSPFTLYNVTNRIYRFTITGVADMIPVKRVSDNAIGMYDLVRNEFFGNAGTGTFTAGAATGDVVVQYSTTNLPISTLPTPTKNGYVFNNWKDSSNNTVTSFPAGTTGNKELTAQYTQCVCTNGTGATCGAVSTNNNQCVYTWACTDGYAYADKTYTTNNTAYTASCTECVAGTYATGDATECTVCAADTYSASAHSSACVSCAAGYTTRGSDYTYHAGVASCKITCDGGYYVATNNALCTAVGSDGYTNPSAYTNGSKTISQGTNNASDKILCQNGEKTAGYGAGADDPYDCGHILHVTTKGANNEDIDNWVHLKSHKYATPSFAVEFTHNGVARTYYGRMSLASQNAYQMNTAEGIGTGKKFKVKYNNSDYTVFDDLMESGYTPVEYLQSSGTQYINTGVVPNSDTKMIVKATRLAIGGFAGSRDGADANNTMMSFATNGTSVIVDFNNSSNSPYRVNYNAGSGQVTVIAETSKEARRLYDANGTLLAENTTMCTDNFTATKPMYLFSCNGSNVSQGSKIYYTKIYDNGTLVRDFIPVKDGTGRPALYDKVNKQFYYNQGSGADFTTGPAI